MSGKNYTIFRFLIGLVLVLSTTFESNAQFIINGSATDLGGGEYLLTPAQGGKVGTVWSD